MNDILAKILETKRIEVATARQMRSEADLLREAKSRKDFTSHRMFAVLALKTFFKTDYRGGVSSS